MTPRPSFNRTRTLLIAALVATGSLALSTAHAQTTPSAPVTSPTAFATSAKAAKTQSAALTKQAADKAGRVQKTLADTEAARSKLAAAAPTPTPAQKDQLMLLELQVAELKEQVEKLGKIAAEVTGLDAQVGVIVTETACASETKGVKPKIAMAKRTADGVVGSGTSEVAVAKTKERAQSAAKVKQILTSYARDVQTIATGASGLATSLAKLGDQAAKLAACP